MASAMIATIPPRGHHAQAAQVSLRFGELPGTSGEERVGRPERPQLVAAGGRVDHLDVVEVHQSKAVKPTAGRILHRCLHAGPGLTCTI